MDIATIHSAVIREHPLATVTAERIYVLPHKALQSAISHYTLFCSKNHRAHGADNASLSIVPDASGCLVFSVTASDIQKSMFWGPSSQSVTVYNGCNVAPLMLFVEFLPGGAAKILHSPMDQWSDLVLPLHDVFPTLDSALREALTCFGTKHPQWAALFHELNRIFLLQLHENPHERLARHLLTCISTSRGALRVQDLSRETGYSTRHLNRIVGEITGLNLKRLARIVRINAACRAIEAQGPTSLTQLAHTFNYHDQAHFIHDFTAICGVTPGIYAKTVSDFYNEDLKLGGISPRK